MTYLAGCLIAAWVGWLWDRRSSRWLKYVLPVAGYGVGLNAGAALAGYVARRGRGA